MLDVRDLAFGFGTRRVGADVSFRLASGETLAVLGGNGAGKTTLFRTLLGLLPAQAGSVLVDGAPLSSLSTVERARRLAYVPQQHVPAFGFSVEEAVLMGRASRLPTFARPGPTDRRIAHDALARLGVEALALRLITELSGGERQLVLVARALAQEAPILILDEPTASLDFGNRARVLAEIDRLRGTGLTIVFSTHEPDHALAHADRALLLAGGKPLALDATERALTEGNVARLYGVVVRRVDVGDARRVFIVDDPGHSKPPPE
jgi:iron complex transport system ATP-binding protein